MDALTALHTRNSVGLLCEPGPNKEQLDNIIQAGLRACDHGWLRPWKYLIIEDAAREQFGLLLEKTKTVMENRSLSDDEAKKVRDKALRAPMIIAVVAKIVEHPKVPEIEQVLSAGASAQMMMTAAHAQGVGAIWRSASIMFHEKMREGLGLEQSDQIVGFIYLGTAKIVKPLPLREPKDYIEVWGD